MKYQLKPLHTEMMMRLMNRTSFVRRLTNGLNLMMTPRDPVDVGVCAGPIRTTRLLGRRSLAGSSSPDTVQFSGSRRGGRGPATPSAAGRTRGPRQAAAAPSRPPGDRYPRD